MEYHSAPGPSEASHRQTSVQAYSRLYWATSQLLLEGPSAPMLSLLNALELGHHFSKDPDWASIAAEHQQIFSLAQFPYESFYLEPGGMVGGPIAEEVARQFVRLDFAVALHTSAADHLGNELRLLSVLCAAEAAAAVQRDPQKEARSRFEQRRFLERHLLRWVFPCLRAIQLENHPFYTDVADLTFELLRTHYRSLHPDPPPPFELPHLPDLLADEQASLRDVAALLMTPCHSGHFLSRSILTSWGRSLSLPRGFSGRTDMLVNLMRSAAQYDSVPALLAAVESAFQLAHEGYAFWLEAEPSFAFALLPWLRRCEATVALLGEMRDQIFSVHGNPPVEKRGSPAAPPARAPGSSG